MINIILRLIAAHVVADFALQFDWLCAKKFNKGWLASLEGLAIHSLIQGAVAYVFVAQWGCWLLPVAVFVTHLLIDLFKVKCMGPGVGGFVIDQLLHLADLVAIAYLLFGHAGAFAFNTAFLSSDRFWIVLIAYLLIFKPSSLLLNMFLTKWEPTNLQEKGLPAGGKWIGYLERMLILTFVIAGNMEWVGFLLAAKSIFRFGELSKPKEVRTTEYVLIGTLSSFAIAIMLGLAVKHCI